MGGGGGGVNFLSNSHAGGSAAKNYNFTVTAARASEPAHSPAKPASAATNFTGTRDIAIDPFANAFQQPITSANKPSLGGGGANASASGSGNSSSGSGFGFIGSDKSDPFGALVQLK